MCAIEFETRNEGSYMRLPLEIPTDKSFEMKVIVISAQDIEGLKRNTEVYSFNDYFFQDLHNRCITVSYNVNIDELIQDTILPSLVIHRKSLS